MQDEYEYLTIIGDNMDDIQKQAREQGLGADRFSLMHRIVRHRLIDSRDGTAREQSVIAATYSRAIPQT